MPEFCTCGAELPPDARFCHKCGKPQREEPHLAAEEPVVVVQQATPAVATETRIALRNPLVLRIGLLTAPFSLILNTLLIEASPIWLIGMGMASVYLYRRRTGEPMSVRRGAKLGWFIGLISGLVFSIPFAWAFVQEITRPDRAERMRQALHWYAVPQASLDQMIAFLQTPGGITMQVVTSLVMLFLLFTLFPALGGALGALSARGHSKE